MEGEAHNYRDIKNLTMASSTHKRLRPDSDDDELNAQQLTSESNANVARFLIVKSDEKDRKVSDLSPLAIEKKAFKQLLAIRKVSKGLNQVTFSWK